MNTLDDIAVILIFRRLGEAPLQTAWFVISVLTELALIYSLRTNKPFWKARMPGFVLLSMTIGAGIIAAFVPLIPWTADIFRFVTPDPAWMLIGVGLVVAYVAVTEFVKLWLVAREKRA